MGRDLWRSGVPAWRGSTANAVQGAQRQSNARARVPRALPSVNGLRFLRRSPWRAVVCDTRAPG